MNIFREHNNKISQWLSLKGYPGANVYDAMFKYFSEKSNINSIHLNDHISAVVWGNGTLRDRLDNLFLSQTGESHPADAERKFFSSSLYDFGDVLGDVFSTDDDSPLTTPYVSGSWARLLLADTASTLSIVNRELWGSSAAVTNVYGDPAVQYVKSDGTTPFARSEMLYYIFKVSNRYLAGTSGVYMNLLASGTPSATAYRGINFLSGAIYQGYVGGLDSYDDYEIFKVYAVALMPMATGLAAFIKGGEFTETTAIFLCKDLADASIYPTISNMKNSACIQVIGKSQTLAQKAESFFTVKDETVSSGDSWTGTPTGLFQVVADIAAGGSAGDKLELQYRVQDANNYLFFRLIWAASGSYNLAYGYVEGGAETVTATSVGTLSAGTARAIYAKVVDNTHNFWTYRTGAVAFTNMYNGVSQSKFSAATGMKVVWAGGMSSVKVYHLARTSSLYGDILPYITTRLLFIGDSKTANNHVQGYTCDFYSRNNSSKLACSNPAAFAVGGATVASRKASIDADIAATTTNPDYILINLGINDVSHVGDVGFPAQWNSDFQYIIDALQTQWPTVPIYLAHVWSSVSNAGYLATLNGWIDDLISANTGVYEGIDERIVLEGGDNGATMTSDGVHPSIPLGERATAEAWLQYLGY